MKLLPIVLLSFLPSLAYPGITAKIPLDSGGYVRLTDTACADEGESVAYSVMKGGEIIRGCWGYDQEEGMVWVRYDGAGSFFYQLTADMLTDYGRAKAGIASDDVKL